MFKTNLTVCNVDNTNQLMASKLVSLYNKDILFRLPEKLCDETKDV